MRKQTIYMTDHTDVQHLTEEEASREELYQEVRREVDHQYQNKGNDLLSHHKVAHFIICHYATIKDIMEKQRIVVDLDEEKG